jgi:hypothetical protein
MKVLRQEPYLVESRQCYGFIPVNKAVMIQHGDYFTIYQNLSSVSVNKGDKIIKQVLGRVRTNGDTGKTVIKFLLYKTPLHKPTRLVEQ